MALLRRFNYGSPVTPPFVPNPLVDEAGDVPEGALTEPKPLPALGGGGVIPKPKPVDATPTVPLEQSLKAITPAPLPPPPSARDRLMQMDPAPLPTMEQYKQPNKWKTALGAVLSPVAGISPLLQNATQDLIAPGYRKAAMEWRNKRQTLEDQSAIEHQQAVERMTQEQRDIARQNYAEQAKDRDEERALRAHTASQNLQQQGAIPIEAPGGVPLPDALSEQERQAGWTIQQGPDGRTYKMPSAAEYKRMQTEATFIPVPSAMQKEFGLPEKAPKETVDAALRALEAKGRMEESIAARKEIAQMQIDGRREIAAMMGAVRGGGAGGDAGNPYDMDAKRVRDMAAKNPALDKDAWDFMLTGRLNTRGRGPQATQQAAWIKTRAGQIMSDLGLDSGELMARNAEFKGNSAAFTKISSYAAQIESFEETLLKNADLAKKLSEEYKRGNLQLYNRVLNAWKTGTGDSEALNLSAQLHGLAREWGKIMQGSVSAMGVPISEANATDALFSKGLANGQLDSLIEKVIKPDAANRISANNAEKAKLLGRIRGVAGGGTGGGTKQGADPLGIR